MNEVDFVFTLDDSCPIETKIVVAKGEKGDKGDPGVDVDDTLSISGDAADAKVTGDEISGLKNALTQIGRVANIAGTDAVNVDLDIADPDGNVLARFANGHIQTKEFDSTDVNDDISDLKSGKIDIAQGVANAGKALVVGADGDVAPKDITIELDDTLTQQGEAADAKAVGDAIDDVEDSIAEVNYNLGKFPEIKNTSDVDSDLFLTDSNGNAIVQFVDGHIKTKEFDSENVASEQDIEDIEASVSELGSAVGKNPVTRNTNAQDVDLDLVDQNGNVLARFEDGHIKTKNFDSSMSDQNAVKTVNNTAPDANGNVNVRAELDPEEVETAVSDYLDEHPVVASAAGIVSVADYGAVGDGLTDDYAAIQNAVNSNYDVYFESDKTYYIASTVTINHDIKLHGGKNTKIKTKSVEGIGYSAVVISGTQKLTTTLTSDYIASGSSGNASNQLSLTSISGIEIGDVIEITATDQYYCYARQYYYLGGVFKVVDIFDGYVYIDRPMCWDITNTANVSVKVYDAPVVNVSGIHFEGDLDPWESGVYQNHILLGLSRCKDSKIENCTFTQFTIGLSVSHSVNVCIDGITLAKSKYANTLVGDGYAITVNSSTGTVIQRVLSLCSQACIDLTGTFPCIDTFVSKCAVASESRAVGIGIHENSYNLIVEDCVLCGMNAYGTVTVNRCRFVKNNRLASASSNGITIRGTHNPKWARFKITNCDFIGTNIAIDSLAYQNGIQPIDSIIDSILIENCTGGSLNINPVVDENILSNTINEITINRWTGCVEIYHKSDNELIKYLKIAQCDFSHTYFINDHYDAHGVVLDNIEYLDFTNSNPMTHKISMSKESAGETIVLPENVPIVLSSSNSNAKYLVCGNKLVSDNADDYLIGTVTGNAGNALTRTTASGNSAATLSMDANGNAVYTQKANTSKYAFYPVGMVYVREKSIVRMSATLINSGATSGAGFYPYIAVVNANTGLITYRGNGSAVQATAEGALIGHIRSGVEADSVVLCYYYCTTPVSESVTTFANASISITPVFAPAVIDSNEQYTAHRLTGDGTLLSLPGVNHIMSSESVFQIKLTADYVNNPIGIA